MINPIVEKGGPAGDAAFAVFIGAGLMKGGFLRKPVKPGAAPEIPPANAAKGGEGRGKAVFDADTIITAMNKPGELATIDAALAGRSPVLPYRTAWEALRKKVIRAQSSAFIRQFLSERGGSIDIANAASEAEASALQARVSSAPVAGIGKRVLKDSDAAIAASAQKAGGLEVLSYDKRFVNALKSIGRQATRLFHND